MLGSWDTQVKFVELRDVEQEVDRGEEDAVEVDMADARLVVNEPRSKARAGLAPLVYG